VSARSAPSGEPFDWRGTLRFRPGRAPDAGCELEVRLSPDHKTVVVVPS
jgi:hypothetical protein